MIVAILAVDGLLFVLYRVYRYFQPPPPLPGDYKALETRVALLDSRLKSYHDDLHDDLRWKIKLQEEAVKSLHQDVKSTRQAIDAVIAKMGQLWPPR